MPARLPQAPVKHKAEVRVQCRVLKDYQETIVLKARHLQPGLSVSREEITFQEQEVCAWGSIRSTCMYMTWQELLGGAWA